MKVLKFLGIQPIHVQRPSVAIQSVIIILESNQLSDRIGKEDSRMSVMNQCFQ